MLPKIIHDVPPPKSKKIQTSQKVDGIELTKDIYDLLVKQADYEGYRVLTKFRKGLKSIRIEDKNEKQTPKQG